MSIYLSCLLDPSSELTIQKDGPAMLFCNYKKLGYSRLRPNKGPIPQLFLLLSFSCTFSCQLFDAGLSFAIVFEISIHAFLVTDRIELTILPW